MPDRLVQAPLLARDASELVMRIGLPWVNLHRALKRHSGRVLFAALLVNQSQLVMGRSVSRVERRRLQVLFKRLPRARRADEFINPVSQQEQQQQQQERRSANEGRRLNQQKNAQQREERN